MPSILRMAWRLFWRMSPAKGVSAALLASTLQGMIYSQLVAHTPLPDIAASANRYLTSKRIGEKYATVIIARLRRDGELEYCELWSHPAALCVRR